MGSSVVKWQARVNVAVVKNQLGYCEPLTVDFIATLVTKEARQLLIPDLRAAKKHVRFDLYTRRNPYVRQVLKTGDQKGLYESNFNATWPVRISIHGWNGMTTTCSSAAIKDAYLEIGDFNVILVDYSDYSLDVNYFRVIAEVFDIAEQINVFTRFLHKATNYPFEQMYLIGHSYGCHVAGVAGKLLKPSQYGVIYALDTAGPIHQTIAKEWRLTPDAALYVESIQTDTALFGYRGSDLGHASFFPNWGLGQPHCPNVTGTEPEFACDHFGSLYYFTESLRNPYAFGAIRCKNYRNVIEQKCGCVAGAKQCPAEVFMGGEPARRKKGVFYLSTMKRRPYGMGAMCRMRPAIESTVVRSTSYRRRGI
ncbi:LOW QUALITY PROTEIN: phospholipase A1 member A-like [Musca vetustissima]|uniref:LOW QUALITY PROTEIN: phospholipase A1 member A-like n=1 Tax=Musca vetustissima TaxID=27455 RepID=UPI002AB62E07|nr:LOW QUALITY PROTEIN: phospholipase A1 member A-like [Musca vetustissima]